MKLLSSDRSSSRPAISTHSSIRLVSTISVDARRKWVRRGFVLLCVICAFVGGFAVSSYWRPPNLSAEPKIQIADFRVEVPEGDTTVVISSRETNGQELGRLQIKREGNVITGVPQSEKRIAARQTLSVDDVAFFRGELTGVFRVTDSPWDKANKIRVWLTHQPHRMAMPGQATRVPREAYEQMKRGQPVLCGNLAEIYAALCEAS